MAARLNPNADNPVRGLTLTSHWLSEMLTTDYRSSKFSSSDIFV